MRPDAHYSLTANPIMTQVDFYILNSTATQPRLLTACRLAEKAYGADAQVFIYTGGSEACEAMDDLLWTFKQGSFLPHERLHEPLPDAIAPILLGHDEPPADVHDVLINLVLTVPPFFSRFNRILEIVDSDAAHLRAGRQRWRFYQDRGYPLSNHRI